MFTSDCGYPQLCEFPAPVPGNVLGWTREMVDPVYTRIYTRSWGKGLLWVAVPHTCNSLPVTVLVSRHGHCSCSVARAPFLVTWPIISPSHLVSHGGGMIPYVQHMFNPLTFHYGICLGPWIVHAEMFPHAAPTGLESEFFIL